MIITEVSAQVFRTTTRRHSDSAGHAHPGPPHQVEQAILTIRTEDGQEGHSFTAPEIVRPHVIDKFVKKVLIGQDYRDREKLLPRSSRIGRWLSSIVHFGISQAAR
jgi:hypothetical protein